MPQPEGPIRAVTDRSGIARVMSASACALPYQNETSLAANLGRAWRTSADDRPLWLNYDGPDGELFREGKRALDGARGAGVFTVGMWVATKRGTMN